MKFALIGKNLKHSYSPIIHNYIYDTLKINASYSLLEINIDEIKTTLDKLKKFEYNGFNVTIPYKIEVMKYLDEISEEAKSINSVNTIKYEDGKLVGYNTDYFGFLEELKYYNINVFNKKCYILGTGGASKACFKVLSDLGANLTLVSRNKTNDVITYEELSKTEDIDIIVNTTPVGMYPDIDSSPIPQDVAKRAKVVLDIIFNPQITKLMTYNENPYNGLLMLIYQALKADEIWLDRKIDVDILKMISKIGGQYE